VRLLINIDVEDLDKATQFYCESLDLCVGRRFDAGVELIGASSPIYLLPKPAGSRMPVHLDFVVDDVAECVARARAAGAPLESEIETLAWGRIALLADPFGNGFCLVQLTGRSSDEIAI
jgi:predicted enzyme related to lactoylglutathione lyase